ncbi:MAG: hypothetical protein Athens101428_780 [Candidatus Berkelbacteria bacterium Athens1014_28]|uniref:Uncharacterized protein n=1 Tax=Candidatus Berkelbacteria bacterium Athens1014_28 TaxID=2017145 RepID=A0A554LJ96_9BACT|nr:MAG: hypothetical protein Athens101428_780 [Candidatus Berkelbacteria bacterium Athens1014_28]
MTTFEDRVMPCKDCGDKFMWTAGEQKFFYDKGLQNEPKRCKKCAAIYKEQLREKHPLFWLTCKKCRKKAEVPFEPKSDDVLCEECFQKEVELRNKKILDAGLSLPE